jgi:DNA-binding NarL/FixJ family response regulator
MRILIAVVQPHYAETLRLSLETRGIEVVGMTTTGKEAVRLARDEKPDIVLIDLASRTASLSARGSWRSTRRPTSSLSPAASATP